MLHIRIIRPSALRSRSTIRLAAGAGHRRGLSARHGVAAHALLKTLCGYEPAHVFRIDARFSSPVYPGETIRTEIWRESPGRAGFRCRVVERDVIVLDNGRFEYRESA